MDLEEALRTRGYRVTRPRQVVWDVLTASHRHLSAQEIADEVGELDPGINVSSVYRAVALFAELSLVRESRTGDDTATTWETSHGDAVIHLVCTECNRVIHHDTELIDELRTRLGELADFEAEAIDVRVTGRCHQCATS